MSVKGSVNRGENYVFSEMKIPWSFFVKTLLSVRIFYLFFFLLLMPFLLLEFSFRNFCAIFPEFYMRYIFISSNSQRQSVSSTEHLWAMAEGYFLCCRILITSAQILVQCHSWIHNQPPKVPVPPHFHVNMTTQLPLFFKNSFMEI